MIEQFARVDLRTFKFPELYVDYLSERLPASIDAPEFFGKKQREEFGTRAAAAVEEPFWRDVLEYNARLGASRAGLEGIEALSHGRAIPIVAGQQPGLLGGPLYTLYKALTAVSLAELLSESGPSLASTSGGETSGTDSLQSGKLRVVPVFWNASDDSDFAEVSSATFFDNDLSLRRLCVAASHHSPGGMVGAMRTQALSGPVEALMRDLEKSPATTFLMPLIEDGLSVAGDWGEFFSALLVRLFSSSGMVVVDSRLSSVGKYSRPTIDAYLREASSVEVRIADCLNELRERGYGEPVSPRSGETCVFLKDGTARRKVSKEELPAVADLWRKGEIELLPNVLLGPVVRDRLMRPAVNVVGPSEASYYIVARTLYDVLGFPQSPVFPRVSLTIVPRRLTSLVGEDPGRFEELVVSFDKVARDYFEKQVPPEVMRELEISQNDMRSVAERVTRLAAVSGKNTEEVAASAARKIDFELGRIREGFVAAHRKRILSENPFLRRAGEFLLPSGAPQERSLCSLSPLIYGGQSLIQALGALARSHVRESLERHVHHYVAGVAIP